MEVTSWSGQGYELIQLRLRVDAAKVTSWPSWGYKFMGTIWPDTMQIVELKMGNSWKRCPMLKLLINLPRDYASTTQFQYYPSHPAHLLGHYSDAISSVLHPLAKTNLVWPVIWQNGVCRLPWWFIIEKGNNPSSILCHIPGGGVSLSSIWCVRTRAASDPIPVFTGISDVCLCPTPSLIYVKPVFQIRNTCTLVMLTMGNIRSHTKYQ